MAPVVKCLQAQGGVDAVVGVTAQHREMLDQVLSIFSITPDFDLDIMRPNQDLFDLTTQILLAMKKTLRATRPDVVLVHGDTTTCFATGLAAFYEGIKVGHVEAGLRTGDLRAPFPEEANRSLVSRITDFHFAPTELARRNLLSEQIGDDSIWVTGNTVIDALFLAKENLSQADITTLADSEFEAVVASVRSGFERFILITGHRRENFGQGFRDLCLAIRDLASSHSNWLFVYPVHLNPNVQGPVNELLSGLDNVRLIAPLSYLPFVWLMDNSDLILTDSGGIQEEGPALGKPVLVMRAVTERPEALEAGTVKLVGTHRETIVSCVEEVLGQEALYDRMASAQNPYGDGFAAGRIVEALLKNSLLASVDS